MHITETDRILAGLAAAYCSYRLWSGTKVGIVYGDGDQDVHANTHPTAYVLTVISSLFVIGLCAYIALDGLALGSALTWLIQR